jgi:hypothetical protein
MASNLDPNANNGLITKIWGPHLWGALHAISFGYPINPTKEQKENYKNFFIFLQHVMPCRYCRESYSQFIKEEGTLLNDDIFINRDSLTRWVYNLHERVNKKLGVNYGVSFDTIRDRYESFRAKCDPNMPGCVMPLDIKAQSYKNAKIKETPIIPYKLALIFKDYGLYRGVLDFNLLDYYHNISKNKKSDEWNKRNDECNNIIFNMKSNAITCTDEDGEFKNKPSIEELKLIARLCTSMSIDDLIKLAKKL